VAITQICSSFNTPRIRRGRKLKSQGVLVSVRHRNGLPFFIQLGKPSIVRSLSLILTILSCSFGVFASEIREFDLKTTERLGNELLRQSQRPDRGATTPIRERARNTASAVLRGRLFHNVRYDYVVLNDPDGTGFLVYALATNRKPGQQITGGHFRITVSADGTKAERIDALSHGIVTDKPALPASAIQVSIATSQIVTNVPVETFIYSSYVYQLPIFVATPDRKVWAVANGRIVRVDDKDLKTAADILNRKK
jgi:hypothetical protein